MDCETYNHTTPETYQLILKFCHEITEFTLETAWNSLIFSFKEVLKHLETQSSKLPSGRSAVDWIKISGEISQTLGTKVKKERLEKVAKTKNLHNERVFFSNLIADLINSKGSNVHDEFKSVEPLTDDKLTKFVLRRLVFFKHQDHCKNLN
jgi:hypothetical protein